ncbi:DUF349 domain-containing protein [Rhodoferax sp.]|uniref:DUF349 domain-containing protein n=1 Tax=Rhodoferax sp. TaxID=50421 RepID=UPI0037836AC2
MHNLDDLTGGAFTAATSAERSARIKAWVDTEPAAEHLAEVFRELSSKDKGAAKLVREKLDEAKRAKGQEALATDWASKAEALLAVGKLNIADAMAWQRDAAKAGAPLSKEPLASLKARIAERVRGIEDLQHQVQVQREAAVLLAQRIEVLSTKPLADARSAMDSLQTDVQRWQTQASELVLNPNWASVDLKFPPLLDASRAQLLVVWGAFQGALALAVAAADDPNAPLPSVPAWAEGLRAAREAGSEASTKSAKPQVDPKLRAQAHAAVSEALEKLEQEVAQGHGKASAGASAALRQVLKEHGKLLDAKTEGRANNVLAAASELEGWQRWRADQLREELVAKAEGLLQRPQGQAMGGRKMQEQLRALREQWKQTDQGGVPNHGLWKRFDAACNDAHKVVEAWLEQVRTQAAEHKAQRLALIAEVRAWAEANRTALDNDWKGFGRVLQQFGERWRDAGHVGEKLFAELQPQWKEAISFAAAPLEELQAQSVAQRQAMIEEAQTLGAATVLRLDAVKSLQQRWQAEAHRVPLERRLDQKLWDAFRQPIDEAFGRKASERERTQAALGERDKAVLDAAKALGVATASGDAAAIRKAIADLDAAVRAQETPAGAAASPTATPLPMPAAPTAPLAATSPAAKPVRAVRGDDRPGMRSEAPATAQGRGAKPMGRSESPRGDRPGKPAFSQREDARGRGPGFAEPARLGDFAFRAQREAMDNAHQALKKLASQAHGEALTQLLNCWQSRDAQQFPSLQDLGARVNAQARALWQRAIAGDLTTTKGVDPATALLRLEIATELPTPAQQLAQRRMLQLQLLTRRNDPAPAQTWVEDTAAVLAGPFDPADARRLQNAIKSMLKI